MEAFAFAFMIGIAVGCACAGMVVAGINEAGWRTDCERLGAHVSNASKVYDCKLREEKK